MIRRTENHSNSVERWGFSGRSRAGARSVTPFLRWSRWIFAACPKVVVLVLVLGSALPALADDWWRVRLPGSERDLWVEVERQRVWITGACDGGRPTDRFDQQGDRLRVEWVEHERADLPRGVVEVEQRMILELSDGSGTLRLEGPASASILVLPVDAVKRDAMPGCGLGG